MNRSYRALLLATLAAAAMTAFSAASAQAFTKFNNASGGNTTIIGKPDGTGKTAHHVLTTPAGSITCSTADLQGTTSVTESVTLALDFEYTNCTFAGISTTVQPHGCELVVNANGGGELWCPSSMDVTFEAAGCKVSIPSQVGSEVLGYTNINSSTEITATTSIKGVRGTASGCASGNGSFTNGEYTTGNIIFTGQEDPGSGMKPLKVS
jgi:hypothetical protein